MLSESCPIQLDNSIVSVCVDVKPLHFNFGMHIHTFVIECTSRVRLTLLILMLCGEYENYM